MAEVDKIVTDFNILRQISKPTTMEEVLDLNLPARLKAACKTAWVTGHGLAAIQIGIPLRFAWFANGPRDVFLLNPYITGMNGKIKAKTEGCLSIPNSWSKVKRAYKVKYVSDGKLLTAKSMLAHIIQHEIDHMDGILNIDVADSTWKAVVRKPKE